MNASTPAHTPAFRAAGVVKPASAQNDVPPVPRDHEALGLPFAFLAELTLKTLAHDGRLRLSELLARLCLPLAAVEPLLAFLRAERLAELHGGFRGEGGEGDIAFALTDLGRLRAGEAMQKNGYVGPCPVTLAAYVERVKRQSVSHQHIDERSLQESLAGLVLPDGLLDSLGPALNSGRAIFIHGPSGSGKTYLAENLVRALQGSIWVPHAFAVGNEIVQLLDPQIHRPLEAKAEETPSLERRHLHDERWVRCRRPVAIVGGELTLDMLELQFDPLNRFHVAPIQLKANNGLLIVDDLGRQRVPAEALLNRWIVPMDRHVDHLTLHGGGKFRVPFDVLQVFSTNLSPAEVADQAFLRRFGYKLHLGEHDETRYRELFRHACSRLGVPFDEAAFRYLVDELHARRRQPLLASNAADLVSKVRDRAYYRNAIPELSPETLNWAWSAYFGDGEAENNPAFRGGIQP